eukprot:998194-Pyramimonas_sp.AAC.1
MSRKAKARALLASAWCCKKCKHPVSGLPWWNHGDASKCTKCNLAKGVAFLCPRSSSSGPSVRADGKGAAASKFASSPWHRSAMAKLEHELVETRARLAQLEAGGGKDKDAMDLDEPDDGSAAAAEVQRRRIRI